MTFSTFIAWWMNLGLRRIPWRFRFVGRKKFLLQLSEMEFEINVSTSKKIWWNVMKYIYIYINIILKLLKVCDDKDSKGFSSSNRMSEHLWFDVLCWLFDETDPPDGRLGSSISDEWPQIISRITNARKKIFEHSKKLSKKEDRWCSWSIRERRYIINKEKKW